MAGEHLEWDTRFFGMPVARLRDSQHSTVELRTALHELRRTGYRIVYWQSTDLERPTDQELQALGGRPVDVRTTFVRDGVDAPRSAEGMPDRVEPFDAERPTRALHELALVAGQSSRFRTDPGFGEDRFQALYTRWIEASVSREIADAVLVIRRTGQEVAMATARCLQGRGEIGLFAVDASVRGRGLGRSLMSGVLEYFGSRGCGSAQVVTQASNEAACRLYEGSGFAVQRVERVFHFWL